MVAACLLVMSLASASAQEAPATVGGMIGRFLDSAKLRSEPPPPADFVRASRPQELDYAPYKPKPAPAKKKTAAELQAAGASLDAAIAANRAKAARVHVPDGAAPQKR